jgi:tetratricopeptide (TPR) repeat protein
LTSAYWALGKIHLRKGDLDRAIAALERGFELGRGWSIRILLPSMTADLGSAYAQSGRLDVAVPLLEQALEQHESIRKTAGLSPRVTDLGRAYLLAGRLDDAAQLLERALSLSLTHREQGFHAHANCLAGELATEQKPLDLGRAETAFGQALALSEELEMRPLAAQCRLGLGRLYWRANHGDRAVEHLSAASAQFAEMDMPFWRAQSDAELNPLT